MGSYTISVVKGNEATKEAHFEKGGKEMIGFLEPRK